MRLLASTAAPTQFEAVASFGEAALHGGLGTARRCVPRCGAKALTILKPAALVASRRGFSCRPLGMTLDAGVLHEAGLLTEEATIEPYSWGPAKGCLWRWREDDVDSSGGLP